MDCILEVHDARIPFSGRNINMLRRMASMKPIVLMLNKVDLVERAYLRVIEDRLRDASDANYIPLKDIFFVNSKSITGYNNRLLSAIFDSVKDRFKSDSMIVERSANLLVMGIPNVGKSTVINRLRNVYMHKAGEATKTGDRPGVTKAVLEKIKICDYPHKLYLYDTPGIIEPSFQGRRTSSGHESYLRCALTGNILENIVDIEIVADYLLYILNRDRNFAYIEAMGMPGPSNDIREVLAYGAVKNNMISKIKSLETGDFEHVANFSNSAERFIRLFRKGEFGAVLLDSDYFPDNVTLKNLAY